jgi:hypothetical protein
MFEPWPPYLAVWYVSITIPYSMNIYLGLWQDYYQIDTLWMEYNHHTIEAFYPWEVFIGHLEILEEHGLLEFEVTNGSVSVLLEECVPEEIKNPSQELEG